MAGNSLYFGRYYKLTLGDDTYVTEPGKPAMDIKFDVTYARGSTARDGTVSILGLSHQAINKFISLAAKCRGDAMSQMIPVRLEAGYFSAAGIVEIFDGFAYYATITSPPNMWLNIKVSEVNPLGNKVVKLDDLAPTNLLDLCNKVLSEFSRAEGLEFEVVDKTFGQILAKEESKRIHFGECTLSDAVRKLNSEASENVLFILRTHCGVGQRILEAVDKKPERAYDGANDVLVDAQNGLLSVSGLDAVSGCVTTFLDGRYPDEMNHLVLRSELNPQGNGRYYIIKKQYVGHFMGQEWYTRYFCSAREDEG